MNRRSEQARDFQKVLYNLLVKLLVDLEHIELEDIGLVVGQRPNVRKGATQITMHKLFDVGAYGSVANGTGAGEDIENHVAAVYW
jgi:hypothetical protein